jgi:flagellar FliL protein
MAANPAPKPEESAAAPAAAQAAAPAAAGGGFKAFLPLIVTVLLMPVLAFVMTQWVLLPKLQKGVGITAAAREETPAKGGAAGGKESTEAKRETYPLNKLLVNVAGTMGGRYLLVSLSIVSADPDFKGKMESHDAQLKDMAGGILQTKTLADLEKPGARNSIRSELLSGFNNILGGAEVQEIYFTEFAIQ